MDELIEIGIPRDRIYASYSGGKGYHVEVFFEGIVSTERLHALYKYVIQKRDLDPRKVEFRPTHTSAIKLPLSAHAKTEKICWYVDRDNLMPIERMDYIMEIQPISLGEIDAA